jgi:flagellin
MAEIDRVGTTTTFNGTSVFTASTTSIYLSDASSNSTIGVSVGALSSAGLGLGSTTLAGADGSAAQTALTAINTAISTIASDRGTIGASINRLQDAAAVIGVQVQNLTAAENGITAADIPTAISNLSRESVLAQTGMAALAQANSQEQSVLTLLH